MEARRFDGFSKAWSTGTPRRRLLKGLPALALASLVPMTARADAASLLPTTAVGASGTTAVDTTVGISAPSTVNTGQVPNAGIGGQIATDTVMPSRIFSGTCGQLGSEAAFQLIDVGAPGAQGTSTPETPTPVGSSGAVPARASTTIIDATLGDLTASPYAIEVRLDAADPESAVVCGNIGGILGGPAPGNELALGLVQQNGSGFTGIAWLQDEGDQTVVNVFLAPGLSSGVGASGVVTTPTASAETADAATTDDTGTTLVTFAVGSAVTTVADVNLRAAPSLEAAIIAILGPGVALEVTGAIEDGWVPVVETSTGRRGYVTDAFIAAASS